MSAQAKKHFPTGERFLLLGGGGMVGQQIISEIVRELDPELIVICALKKEEASKATESFKRDFPDFPHDGRLMTAAGDVFVRREWNPSVTSENPIPRARLLKDSEYSKVLYEDSFGDAAEAYNHSELVRLITAYEPDVIIDSINTATAFSYQDVYAASDLAKREYGKLREAALAGQTGEELMGLIESAGGALDSVLISQSMPQLVRHVLFINQAMRKVNTRLYLKVGTTGTGGMGLNIPYTHSEVSPSATLMEKTAVAFAHTGLLYLMARTFGGPAIKEFKPAAMIGYSDISYHPVKVKGKVGVRDEYMKLYSSGEEKLSEGGDLRLRPRRGDGDGYGVLGDLSLALVNTGENGFFTKGEFQAITYMRQMEFITPEEIARQVALEVMGSNTGYDVIAAIDGASMNPTYRAGYLRHFAIEELERLEEENGAPSVALGDLGPPELGKLLWEAYLLHVVYDKEKTGKNELLAVLEKPASDVACEVYAHVRSNDALRNTIVSVGLPILAPDGESLIRGPYIRYPEKKNEDEAECTKESIDKWARKGWVDLRPANFERWQGWFEKMRRQPGSVREHGSAAFTRESYLSDWIKIGAVVGWVFNNEKEFGYRIK
jgi:hypothetical protein